MQAGVCVCTCFMFGLLISRSTLIAFIVYNALTNLIPEFWYSYFHLTTRAKPKAAAMRAILNALQNTKNKCTSGILWRLSSPVRDAHVGRAQLWDIGTTAEVGDGYFGESNWSDMATVMVPKAPSPDERLETNSGAEAAVA